MAVFTLIGGTQTTELDAEGQAQLSVTVSNETQSEIRARVVLQAATPNTDPAWIPAQERTERAIKGSGVECFSAMVRVPRGSPAGEYAVRWRVQSVRNPDRERLDGEPISFVVRPIEVEPTAPTKRFPLWIVFGALGAVSAIAAAALLFLLWPPDQVPSLVGMSVAEANATLRERGWIAVPTGYYGTDGVAPGAISKQEPAPGNVPESLKEAREVRIWLQPAAVVAAAPKTACVEMVQNKIAWNYEGFTSWNPSNVARLCAGAEGSKEPPECFERVMHGGVDWGGGTTWNWQNAIDLCEQTHDASATVACFEAEIRRGVAWYPAIKRCEQG